ncbi:hypothetical protein P5G50_02440 [Leifsonia sp. F6_8S_P_1B]|uniref:Glutaminase n=1 Tax=Leifsonia williamsii TaxID=3035919 RepID=A0ABT8K779_9MICO|nr:hypothetical protein [Leifsonia williamsii]MDN4613300.1 hypothetical protein [Leifsonia williamsii]
MDERNQERPPARENAEEAVAAVRETLAATIARLSEAGARTELLAELITDRRTLFIRREPVLRPIGRVWRLGVVLLGVPAEGRTRQPAPASPPDAVQLWATGNLIRATTPGRTQYVSLSAETRRAYRAAAERGHIPSGATVNFDAPAIRLDAESLSTSAGPLLLRDGRVLVRWSAAVADADARDFRAYVEERADLLAHPPEGA